MKRVFTLEKGWQEVDDGVSTGLTELPTPPKGVYEDTVEQEIDTDKLPFERVLNNHIIVLIDKYKKPKASQVIRPKSAQGLPTGGTVVAIAANITDIKVGDRVLYSQFAGYLLVFEGLPFMRTLGYEEILAILKKDAPELILEGV